MPGSPAPDGLPAPDGFPLGAAVTLTELEADPHPVLARLRARVPVSWLPILGGWLVTRLGRRGNHSAASATKAAT